MPVDGRLRSLTNRMTSTSWLKWNVRWTCGRNCGNTLKWLLWQYKNGKQHISRRSALNFDSWFVVFTFSCSCTQKFSCYLLVFIPILFKCQYYCSFHSCIFYMHCLTVDTSVYAAVLHYCIYFLSFLLCFCIGFFQLAWNATFYRLSTFYVCEVVVFNNFSVADLPVNGILLNIC